jgi:regulator of sirC expression with transglutaminase-like and TPR domain
MPGRLHFDAPTALEYFAALVADDATLPLLEAAVALAQDDDAGLDVQGVLARVDTLAERLSRRIAPDAPPLQRLRLLNRYFFHELGFAGNVNNYYDRSNSLLPAVLETRRGIPITLAVLYMEMAAQVGLQAQGVSFPGHFLVKLHMPRGEVVIDPFTGHSLSREDLEARLQPYRRQQGLTGDEEVPLGLFLQPAAPREVIARMLRNLKEIHRSACDWQRLAAVLQRLVILLPQAWEERRDRALVLAELGCHEQAAGELALYLQHRGDAADAAVLHRHLLAWRQRLH